LRKTVVLSIGALSLLFLWLGARMISRDDAGPRRAQDAGAARPDAATTAPAAPTSQPAAPAPRDQRPATRPQTPVSPLDLIPAESLLAWKGLPVPSAQRQSSQASAVDTLLDMIGRFGPAKLDRKARLSISLVKAFGDVVRYPFAFGLIDAKARPTESGGDSRKVDDLRLALVIQAGPDGGPFPRLIQKITNEHTDAGQATLELKRAGDWQYQTLRDQRLDDWSIVSWGQLGDFYVITLGQEVWPLVAQVASGQRQAITRVEWIDQVQDAEARLWSDEPLIEIIVSAQDIRKRLDPFVGGRASDFFRAWHAENVTFAHWAMGFEGHAMYCMLYFRDGDRTRRRVYADHRVSDERYLGLVPPDANYAVFNVSAPELLPQLISSYYATRSPDDRARAERLWAQIQAEHGVDAQRDALDNLGDTIVLHSYPPHPLRLPLAFTTLIEIERSPEKVRHALETLCEAWQDGLDRIADESGHPTPAVLRRDSDGVWFFRFGPVTGVSWTFTDRYLVACWAPDPLRQYLDRMGERLGRRAR